jgi:hypothetical protein
LVSSTQRGTRRVMQAAAPIRWRSRPRGVPEVDGFAPPIAAASAG